MRDVMMNHLKETGKNLVLDVESCNDPIVYTKNLLTLRGKYERIVDNALQVDIQHMYLTDLRYSWSSKPI